MMQFTNISLAADRYVIIVKGDAFYHFTDGSLVVQIIFGLNYRLVCEKMLI